MSLAFQRRIREITKEKVCFAVCGLRLFLFLFLFCFVLFLFCFVLFCFCCRFDSDALQVQLENALEAEEEMMTNNLQRQLQQQQQEIAKLRAENELLRARVDASSATNASSS